MIESFPFFLPGSGLTERDFIVFGQDFRHRIAEDIPHSGPIYFHSYSEPPPKISTDPRVGSELASRLSQMHSNALAACKVGSSILLSFTVQDNRQITAIITQADPLVIEHSPLDWLTDIHENLTADFIAIKSRYADNETGLLNASHLFDLLETWEVESSIAFLLVSLPINVRRSTDAFRHGQMAAKALLNLTGNRSLLHHLGQSLFAILVPETEIGSTEQFSSRLAQLLRREQFSRVHIGSRRVSGGKSSGRQLLDEAWTALQTASKRGPFAFCDYSFLESAETHPLRAVAETLVERYLKIIGKEKSFAVLQFGEVSQAEVVDGIAQISRSLEGSIFLGSDSGPVIIIKGITGGKGAELGEKLLEELKVMTGEARLCCGVSYYPFASFSRKEVLLNSRKAVFHAELLGPGETAQFDAISMNVSGDIHFADGDLASALKEYRRGVGLNPDDVNLLNSLGVTHALLNHNSSAQAAFTQVLEIDQHNSLALYNLGLEAQAKNDTESAIEYFEKARLSCELDDDSGVCQEVEVQLGRLYCQVGRYQEAKDCLSSWMKKSDQRHHLRVFKYMGETYLGIGQPKEAMGWLQRALRYNENDAEVISLLGIATWKAGEGDDIALSFCHKSVDLEPEDTRLRLRLAELQREMGRADEALLNLLLCNGRHGLLTEIQLAKAKTFLVLDDEKQARVWARRVLKRAETSSGLYQQAELVVKSLQ